MNRAFAIGNKGEQAVIEFFTQNGIEAVKDEDKTKRYDHDLICKLGKTKFTCEVKFDAMAAKTGNVAIEHHNSKKDEPSGIEVTKADIWVHLLKDDNNITIWATNVKTLKEFVKNNEPLKKIVSGGDANASLYIYQLDRVLNTTFVRLETLSQDSLHKTIKKMLKGE